MFRYCVLSVCLSSDLDSRFRLPTMEHLILLWLPMRHSTKLKQLTRIPSLCSTIVSSRSSGTTATKFVSHRSFSHLYRFFRRANCRHRTTTTQHRVKGRQRRPTPRRQKNRFRTFRIRRNFTGSKLNKRRAIKSNFHRAQPLLLLPQLQLQHRCRRNRRTSLRESRGRTPRRRQRWRSTGKNKA